MKITIICVGKLKESYWKDAVAEYQKRLSAYTKIEIIEVADEKTPDQASDVINTQIKDKEGERILKNVKDEAFVITLEIGGKSMDSVQFSKYIEQLGVQGKSNICFIIGGSLGLSKAVCSRSNFRLSFSAMTFPHQLMRVILLEQIYRGYRIMNHEPYHK